MMHMQAVRHQNGGQFPLVEQIRNENLQRQFNNTPAQT